MFLKNKPFIKKKIGQIKKLGIISFVIKNSYITTKLFLGFSYCLFFLPFYFIILILKPFLLIRISPLPTEKIGPMAILTGIYLSEKKIFKKKNLDIFYIKDNICNLALFNIFKKKILLMPKIIVEPINKINNFFKFFFKFPTDHTILKKRSGSDYYNIVENAKIKYEFSNEEKKLAEQTLEKMGLKGKKFVCLIVRDSKFTKKNFKHLKTSHNNFRNSEIINFKLAAKALSKKGLFVVRIGRDAEKKFLTNDKKIIDYSFSRYISDLMDIYLISKSEFIISTHLGLDSVGFIFRKPICYVNSCPLANVQNSGSKNIVLTKRHFYKNKELSLKGIFNHGVAFAAQLKDYSKKRVKIKEQNPTQIKNTVLEMYFKIIKKNKPKKNQLKLQKKFKKLFLKNIFQLVKNYGDNEYAIEHFNPIFVKNALKGELLPDQYMLSSNFSHTYLTKNKWWLD